MSIDAGVQVVASSSQNHSMPVQAPVLVPVACFVSKRSQNSQVSIIEKNDEATKFYTGLSSWKLFDYLATSLENAYPAMSSSGKLSLAGLKISPIVLVVLCPVSVKPFRDGLTDIHFREMSDNLAIMRNHSVKLASYFQRALSKNKVHHRLLRGFIEHPCSYKARAQTYSNYKKHNTVKFLDGITPNGAFSFLSKCWGGRALIKLSCRTVVFCSSLNMET